MARELRTATRTIRRMRLYGRRAMQVAPGRKPRHPCLFLHLPKCGGTSVAEALYATVPIWERITVLDAESTRRAAAILRCDLDDPLLGHDDLEHGADTFRLREQIMLAQMAWGSPLIHGHVLWSEAAERHFGEAYKIVTLMRNPVERTISNYRMARRRGIAAENFEDYIETPLAKAHARVFLRYLSGVALPDEDDIAQLTQIAIGRLSACAVIGFLDDLDGFAAAFEREIGPRLRIPHFNAAEADDVAPSPAELDRIRTLCAPDLEIYAAARGLELRRAA